MFDSSCLSDMCVPTFALWNASRFHSSDGDVLCLIMLNSTCRQISFLTEHASEASPKIFII